MSTPTNDSEQQKRRSEEERRRIDYAKAFINLEQARQKFERAKEIFHEARDLKRTNNPLTEIQEHSEQNLEKAEIEYLVAAAKAEKLEDLAYPASKEIRRNLKSFTNALEEANEKLRSMKQSTSSAGTGFSIKAETGKLQEFLRNARSDLVAAQGVHALFHAKNPEENRLRQNSLRVAREEIKKEADLTRLEKIQRESDEIQRRKSGEIENRAKEQEFARTHPELVAIKKLKEKVEHIDLAIRDIKTNGWTDTGEFWNEIGEQGPFTPMNMKKEQLLSETKRILELLNKLKEDTKIKLTQLEPSPSIVTSFQDKMKIKGAAEDETPSPKTPRTPPSPPRRGG